MAIASASRGSQDTTVLAHALINISSSSLAMTTILVEEGRRAASTFSLIQPGGGGLEKLFSRTAAPASPGRARQCSMTLSSRVLIETMGLSKLIR
jgi:hypothetical protein